MVKPGHRRDCGHRAISSRLARASLWAGGAQDEKWKQQQSLEHLQPSLSTPWCQAQRAHRKVPGAAGGAQDTHTGLGMKPTLPAEECSSPLSPLHLLDEFHTNKDLKAFFSLMTTPYIRELFMNSNTEPHSKELHLCSCPRPLQKMETGSPPLEREEEEVIPLLIADNLFWVYFCNLE